MSAVGIGGSAAATRGDSRGFAPARRQSFATGGILVACGAIIWFVAVADRIFASGHLDPLLSRVWAVSEDPAAVAGQWLAALLLGLARKVPEAGPESLVLLTCISAGFIMGLIYVRFRRCEWNVAEALAAVVLLSAHPAVLMLATTGQPDLLATLLVGIVALTIDRVARVGDAQSLMSLGLVLAALVLTAPDALYIALPMVALLPLCLKDVRDVGSAVSLFLLTFFPAAIAIGAILLAAATFGEAPSYAIRRWLAPMHGVLSAADVPWLVRYGGRFWEPLVALQGLFIVAMPVSLIAFVSLLVRPDERMHPVTPILALVGGPLAGAGATLFYHTAGPLPAIGTGIAMVIAWTASRPLQSAERWLWLAWLVLGLAACWFTGWLWDEPDRLAWRNALLR